MRSSLFLLAAVAAGLAACATPGALPAGPSTVAAPAALVPAGRVERLRLHAAGVQLYECRAGSDGKAAWAFTAPRARLVDARGRPAGDHGAGPTWRAPDGSRITGRVVARVDAPDAGAIPWLLLSAQSSGPAGLFGDITDVQRLATVGGVAPADGCSAATTGTTREVPYSATYVFLADGHR